MRFLQSTKRDIRHGVAAVELAVVLPLMMFLFGIGVDFARVFYAQVIITNASRDGALYACSNPTTSIDTGGIQAVALNDATDLDSTVTVTSGTFSDGAGTAYVWVSVSYPFQTITALSGVQSPFVITQQTTMRIQPMNPRPGSY